MVNSLKTEVKTITSIDENDYKTLYNIDNGQCDYKLIDCKGREIIIQDVLIKDIKKYMEDGKELEEPVNKMFCIIIDKDNKTYVTTSKMFSIQLKRFIERYGIEAIKLLPIRIIEKEIKGSKNKGLGFELI